MITSAGGAAQACALGPSNCVAPPGLDIFFAVYPGLTPWATFLTRLTALANSGPGDMDPLDSYQEVLKRAWLLAVS